MTSKPEAHDAPHAGGKLTLMALGVVFGDIGTSPLYALRECFSGEHGVEPTHANVLGVLSLVFWSLTMVVTVKYLTFIMRADNQGEGGILALLALVPPRAAKDAGLIGLLAGLVLFGAALLYGDGVITPAISVLSAVEGLETATLRLRPVVVPLTCVILIGLFAVQRRGTAAVGFVFGPIMLVWFGVLAVLGAIALAKRPAVLAALDPRYAAELFASHGYHAFLVLGAVVLVITGGEALYADMGHFGRVPIRRAWFAVVMPSLVLNYFGQGALLLDDPVHASQPFYALVPPALLYPMVALSTAATIIASQALISGAYSLTRQAIQLGFFPRVTIRHTSGHSEGQIYVPEVNAALAIACVWLVLTFRASSQLAAAYGIAVTGTMGITSIVYYVVLTRTWGWPRWRAGLVVGLFLFFDVAFFGANALKFFQGGWFPVGVALAIFVVMTTWKRGRALLATHLSGRLLPLDAFLDDLDQVKPHRVHGTAVFMTSSPDGVPLVLLHHFKHNQVLHKSVVLLSILSEHVPEVPAAERVTVRDLGRGFFRVVARYGFMQTPNVPQVMREAAERGVPAAAGATSYFLGRETLLATGTGRLPRWQKGLYAFLSRNARSATEYFGIPADRVVELGLQVDL